MSDSADIYSGSWVDLDKKQSKSPHIYWFFRCFWFMKLIRLRLGNNRDVWALQQTTHNPNQRFHLQHMTHNCIVCWWFQVRWCGRLTSWLACIVRHCETRRIKPHSSPTTQRLSHYCRERTREASLWCKMSFFLFICCNNDVKEQKVASVLGVLVHVAAFVTSEISLQFMWRQRSQCYLYLCVLKQI